MQTLSGEYDYNYENMKREINKLVEKSQSDLFELCFDEQNIYTYIQLSKLLYIKPIKPNLTTFQSPLKNKDKFNINSANIQDFSNKMAF